MNLIVCVKQVPDTTDVKIDPATNTLVRQGVAAVLNPFDAYAVEEAVRIREKHGGKVTALTMGPPQAVQVLRDAIAVGADEGILLSDRAFAGADTLALTDVSCLLQLEGRARRRGLAFRGLHLAEILFSLGEMLYPH